MTTETLSNGIIRLAADDGKTLTNGETHGSPVYLPPTADASVWREVDANYDEEGTLIMRTFSKLKIVMALSEINLYDAFEAWLKEANLWKYWDAANDLREDNADFSKAITAAKTALGVSDEQIEAILAASVAEG